MEKLVLSAEALTPKGFLKKATLEQIRNYNLERILPNVPFIETENGTYAYAPYVTPDGREVYVTMHLTVGFADPFVKVEKKVKEKTVEIVEVPNIFE